MPQDYTKLEVEMRPGAVLSALNEALTAMSHFGSSHAHRSVLSALLLEAHTEAAEAFRRHEQEMNSTDTVAA